MMGILILFFSLIRCPDNYDVWTYPNAKYVIRQQILFQYGNEKQDTWARENLQSGDIVFRKGNEVIFHTFNFSDYICNITKSKYSHCGIIWRVFDDAYVIDMDRSGTRKINFSLWMNECANKNIKVMRLKDGYEYSLIQAEIYLWKAYIDNIKFDYNFKLGGETFYCAELVYNTYRAGRLCLAQPVKTANLPGISDRPYQNVLVILGSRLYCDETFDFEKKIISTQSISESKYLNTIYEGIIDE